MKDIYQLNSAMLEMWQINGFFSPPEEMRAAYRSFMQFVHSYGRAMRYAGIENPTLIISKEMDLFMGPITKGCQENLGAPSIDGCCLSGVKILVSA